MSLDASPTYSLSYDATSTLDPDDEKQYVIRLAFTFLEAYCVEPRDVIDHKYRKYSRKWNSSSSILKRVIESGKTD